MDFLLLISSSEWQSHDRRHASQSANLGQNVTNEGNYTVIHSQRGSWPLAIFPSPLSHGLTRWSCSIFDVYLFIPEHMYIAVNIILNISAFVMYMTANVDTTACMVAQILLEPMQSKSLLNSTVLMYTYMHTLRSISSRHFFHA